MWLFLFVACVADGYELSGGSFVGSVASSGASLGVSDLTILDVELTDPVVGSNCGPGIVIFARGSDDYKQVEYVPEE